MTGEERYRYACSLLLSGDADGAAAILRQLLDENPGHPDILNALATALDRQGECSTAARLVRQAIALLPDSAAFHYNLGNILRRCNDPPGAEEAYLAAIHADPFLAEPYHGLGSLCREQGRVEAAESALRKALELSPGLVFARHDLAEFLRDTGRIAEAEAEYRSCLALNPDYPPALNGLGMLLLRRNSIYEAEACFRSALAADPGYLQARCNLAVLATWQGELEQAIAELYDLVRHAPEDGDIHFNLSLALLTAGRMEEGFREHEWRFCKRSPVELRHTAIPRWQGEELAGKSILLHAEQGYGDAIQFVRYASLLAQQGATVLVEGQDRRITPFLATAKGVAAAVSRGEPLPYKPDFQIPMMSLPIPLGSRAWPPPPPSFHLSLALVARWKQRLAPLPGLKVGLAWAGRPEHGNDANRSLPPEELAPLKALEGISWVSLQFGGKVSQPHLPLHDFSNEVDDFTDSAHLVAALDLVITVDSAIAHLAGSLMVPVWLLLPWNPDWRWMRQRQDTDWYSSMRIFRQKRPGQWFQLLKQIASLLQRGGR